MEFHIHHAKEAAKIVKILSLLDPKTGKVTKKSPRCLVAKQNAMVEVGAKGSASQFVFFQEGFMRMKMVCWVICRWLCKVRYVWRSTAVAELWEEYSLEHQEELLLLVL